MEFMNLLTIKSYFHTKQYIHTTVSGLVVLFSIQKVTKQLQNLITVLLIGLFYL